MPVCVTLASLLDLASFFGFHWMAHPWGEILKEEKLGEVEELLKKAEDIILSAIIPVPPTKIDASEQSDDVPVLPTTVEAALQAEAAVQAGLAHQHHGSQGLPTIVPTE